jgi:transitional endoplasmic reticulum ATPase
MSVDANGDISFLLEAYDRYLSTAQKAQREGHLETAKRNYASAAQTLAKVAKLSDGNLKKARFEKAKTLLDIADRLTIDDCKPEGTTKIPAASKDKEESENKWKSAKIPDVHFSDIIGLDDVKNEIRMRMIEPFLYPEQYHTYRKDSGGGVLLYGPPGNGKTQIAKAIANEVGATFYFVTPRDIMSMWVGQSENNIATLFETASADPKAIIFIDELDGLFAQRGTDEHNDQRVDQFLQMIDGFNGRSKTVLLLGATNRPWDIDSAALRSGRFTSQIYVHLPEQSARLGLFHLFLKGLPLEANIDYGRLAKETPNFSGADIQAVCDRAKNRPLREAIESKALVNITQNDLEEAVAFVSHNINLLDISRFEAYANKNSDLYNKSKDEKNNEKANGEIAEAVHVVDIHKSEAVTEIKLKQDSFVYIPNEKMNLVLSFSFEATRVVLKLGEQNLLCTKDLSNWVSEPFTMPGIGVYPLVVTADGKTIGTMKITFTDGLGEQNLGI